VSPVCRLKLKASNQVVILQIFGFFMDFHTKQ
jgi:hypothetical protein